MVKDKSQSYFWSLFYDIVRDARGGLKQRSDKKIPKGVKIARKSFSPVGNNITSMTIGNLYAHIYIPKYKDDPSKLPFYDEFPLYLPISYHNGLIYAFNIHYLKPNNRKIFLSNYIDYLKRKVRTYYTLRSNQEVDLNDVDQKLLQQWGITYMNQFMGAHKNSVLKVCIRSYLLTHIASRIFQLNMSELEDYKNLNITFSPVFKRATAKEIYAEVEKNYMLYSDSNWRLK
jgi:hypothetical protein